MGKETQKLKALALTRPIAPGYHADGDGLYLQVTASGAKSWIYRFALAGRRREMGLGRYPDVSLAAAREAATEARKARAAGRDPIAARDAERARKRLEEVRGVLFRDAAQRFLDDHEPTWRNPKHRQQWRNTLTTYVYPAIGDVSVGAVGTPEVTKILDAIWRAKPETAGRVRGRIERILDWSKARGYRTGENPARWRGHLDAIYPHRAKVRKVRHHPAVPVDDMPKVYAKLAKAPGVASLAARFTILTAVRGGETTGARPGEVDRSSLVWTIPAERMKADRAHRVPLSRQALAILNEVAAMRADGDKHLFPGQRTGRPLSLSGLVKALRAAGAGAATMHGCRSTFKDWASERTSFAGEVSEMALAHSIDSKVERAYRRGDMMKKRAALMQTWADYVSNPAAAKVLRFAKVRG